MTWAACTSWEGYLPFFSYFVRATGVPSYYDDAGYNTPRDLPLAVGPEQPASWSGTGAAAPPLPPNELPAISYFVRATGPTHWCWSVYYVCDAGHNIPSSSCGACLLVCSSMVTTKWVACYLPLLQELDMMLERLRWCWLHNTPRDLRHHPLAVGPEQPAQAQPRNASWSVRQW